MQGRTLIEPKRGWRVLNLDELLRYRDLFRFLVLRDLRVIYKQTALGFGWAVIRPTMSMVIFSLVFGRVASIPSDGVPYPLFSMAAVVPWTYFATALGKSSGSLVGSSDMLSKVYFPRLFIPLTSVMAGLVDFAIALLILGSMMAWYGVAPSPSILFLPLLVTIMMLTSAGLGLWLSALAIQYRDVNQAMTFLVQLLMFGAPVVWPVSLLTSKISIEPEVVRWIYGLYPMAGVIEGFRAALLGTASMPWDLIASGTLASLLIAISGAFYFRRMERVFADVA